jgi:hypothetical protein
MKLSTLSAVFAFSLAATLANALDNNDRVRVEVRPHSEADRKNIKGASVDTKSQTYMLEIVITGKPKSPETRAVKWYIFGKDLKSNAITILESAEEPLNLTVRGEQKIETKKAESTSTPEHVEKKKKVEAKGVRIVGHGVQVKDADIVVGESFSSETLKPEAK